MFSRPVYTLPNRSHFSSSCCVVQNTFLLALKQPRFVRRFHLMAESGEILLDKVFHRLLFFFLATVAVQRSVSAAPPHKAAPLWRKITLISSFCLLHASCRQPEESSMRLRQALGCIFHKKLQPLTCTYIYFLIASSHGKCTVYETAVAFETKFWADVCACMRQDDNE